jgi:hypothetical protein
MEELGLLGGTQFIDEGEHLALSGVDVLLLELFEFFGGRLTEGIFRVTRDLPHEVGDGVFNCGSHDKRSRAGYHKYVGRRFDIDGREGKDDGVKRRGGKKRIEGERARGEAARAKLVYWYLFVRNTT